MLELRSSQARKEADCVALDQKHFQALTLDFYFVGSQACSAPGGSCGTACLE